VGESHAVTHRRHNSPRNRRMPCRQHRSCQSARAALRLEPGRHAHAAVPQPPGHVQAQQTTAPPCQPHSGAHVHVVTRPRHRTAIQVDDIDEHRRGHLEPGQWPPVLSLGTAMDDRPSQAIGDQLAVLDEPVGAQEHRTRLSRVAAEPQVGRRVQVRPSGAGLTGLTLSGIFFVYSLGSISTAFFVTAGAFAALSIYGTVTKRDLSAWGTFLFMGLIGVVIASIVQFWWSSPGFTFVLSCATVVVFAGLTAYDTQKLRVLGAQYAGAGLTSITIVGALNLYLDFINLFLALLRLFGDRRR